MTINVRPEAQNVLVLDDEPHVIAAITDVLEDHYNIISETSANLALERLKDGENISTILCDQRMPEMNGDVFLKHAKEHTDATKILITGYADLQAVIRAVNEGNISGYLTKPWQINSLVSTVRSAVDACELYRALLAERALFNDLMRSISDGVFIKDRAGKYLRLNEAEGRILGFDTPTDAIGKTLDDFLAPDFAQRWGAAERQAIEDEDREACHLRTIVAPDGTKRWYSVKTAACRNQDDEVTGLVGVSRDVTGERRVEKMKDEFVSSVSHELRTPITSILGSMSVLRGGLVGALPGSAEQMIEICCRNGDRLLRLVNDVLDFEKIKVGEFTLERELLDVSELLREAAIANKGYGRQGGKTIQIAEPIPPVCVNGDRGRLLQVLSNLISNAMKFSPEGATVRLRATVTGHHVRIAIVDRGSGIPLEFRSRIFDAFSQADSSDTRAKGGTGLGLSISRAIIESHNGQLDYRSRLNLGTKFYFELPIASSEPGASGNGSVG